MFKIHTSFFEGNFTTRKYAVLRLTSSPLIHSFFTLTGALLFYIRISEYIIDLVHDTAEISDSDVRTHHINIIW